MNQKENQIQKLYGKIKSLKRDDKNIKYKF